MIDEQKIKQLDAQNVYGSIEYLPKQIEQVIEDFKNIEFPREYNNVDSIIISGMGGSIYNYYVISSLFYANLKKPIVMVNGYTPPGYLNKDTLFIGSSYSGSTEETIASTNNAIKTGAKVTAVSAGGKLGELIKSHNLPHYTFEPRYNPCGQPRVGLGYTIFGPIMLLAKLQLVDINTEEIQSALETLKSQDAALQEQANELAKKLHNTMPILVSSEHLSSNVHIFRNQINETAKSFAEYHLIPELNHHLMEGLTYPKDKNLLFVFLNSHYYYERVSKRYEVTKDVLGQQKVNYLDLHVNAKTKLEEFLLYLQLGSYTSFFMGMQNDINPSAIPWVDYFKEKMG